MANPVTNQNQQIQINLQELKADIHKRLSLRNWLRKAASAATGAVVLLLVLTGCTKEQWTHLKNTPPPFGGVGGSEPSIWYNLRVTYKDEDGATKTRFMGPIDSSASNPFYAYMQISWTRSKFKLHPTPYGWAYWEIDDGNWLSLKATGWAYRSFES